MMGSACSPGTSRLAWAVASLVIATSGACAPDTTSFRATDQADFSRPGPIAAAYNVRMADQPIAEVRVWSNGGYVSVSDQPMTHLGFEIHNNGGLPIMFDGELVTLTVFDRTGAALPATPITPFEPAALARRPIRPGATVLLGAYLGLPVQPRAVATMQVQWALRAADQRYLQVTSFARDDEAPIVAPRSIEAIEAGGTEP